MYLLRKSFRFRNILQAQAFVRVAAVHGKTSILGSVVTLEARLDFTGWRKLGALARLVRESGSLKPDIEALSAQAGLSTIETSPAVASRPLLTH